jgi:hypothetical protein
MKSNHFTAGSYITKQPWKNTIEDSVNIHSSIIFLLKNFVCFPWISENFNIKVKESTIFYLIISDFYTWVYLHFQ